MEPVNPYNERGLIRQHEKFFGRSRELREVFSNLRNMQSVSVVGPRRIGKSSFLYRVAHPLPSELSDSFRLHYIDLQRVFSVEDFYERACNLLGREDGGSPLDLEEAIQNKKVIFCLDEFEQAYKENFGSQFFNALRSLAQTGNLALVVATQEPLDELHRQYLRDEDVTSKFHNIFSRVNLGPFTDAEAREIVSAERNGWSFTQAERELILELADNYPYRLNLACALLYDARREGRILGEKPGNDLRETLRAEFQTRLAASAGARASEPAPGPRAIQPLPAPAAASSKYKLSLRISIILSLLVLLLVAAGGGASTPPGLMLIGLLLFISLVFLVAIWISKPISEAN